MYQRQESEFAQAKIRAAQSLCRQRLRPCQLPTNHEIREELKHLAGVYDVATGLPNETHPADRESGDRFRRYRDLLVPLSKIQQDRKTHPEGDVLYHSLQVFRLAWEAIPYDEDFLLAALLHDVGKGIDPYDHVSAGLQALGSSVSERTAWLIGNLESAKSFLAGTIGVRARRRLQSSESYDELILLAKCDVAGRVPGVVVPELFDALDRIRALAEADD